MSRLGQVVSKTLAILVAIFFVLGAVVTAGAGLFGGSKVGVLFEGSADALAGDGPPTRKRAEFAEGGAVDAGTPELPRDPIFMHASKAGPMPVPRRPMVDAGAGKPDAGERVFFPASKSMGGLGLPRQAPTQQTPAPQ